MTPDWMKALGLNDLKLPALDKGAHKADSGKLCAMEMVAFIERLPHSDRPACTCPVVASLVIFINDTIQEGRNRLLPWLPKVVGTVAPAFERARAHAILQAVFDAVVQLHHPKVLHRHMRRDFDGTRVALPPWDYAPWLQEQLRDYRYYHGERQLSPYGTLELANLREKLLIALAATEPRNITERALECVGYLRGFASRYGQWAREPVIARSDLPSAVPRGEAPTAKLTALTVRDCAPAWDAWRFQLLEHVLALGPSGKGWSRPQEDVIERLDALAEMA